jgi:hypothetical protein
MFCTNCGEDAPRTALYCAKCGTRVAPEQTTVLPSTGNLPAERVAPAVAYPQAAVASTQDDTCAILSLVFGILSLAGMGILASIPAIILGNIARKNIRASGGRLSGQGMATAGMILGWISCGLFVLVVFIFIIIFVGAVATSH